MKRAIIFLIAINASLILFLAGLLYLAETYPFHPGNPLFGVQSMAEQARINLTADPVHKAEMNFELVERRLADLVLIRQGGRVEPAVRAFDNCLTAAIHSIEALPAQEAEVFYQDVENQLVRVQLVLSSLDARITDQSLLSMETKIAALQSATTSQEIQKIGNAPPSIPVTGLMAKVIPFLGKDVDHVDFPLTGGHDNLECLECHDDGIYVDTPVSCSSCHFYDDVLLAMGDTVQEVGMVKKLKAYPYHFTGECSDCHDIESWQSSDFDHQGVWECISCHSDDLPREEYDPENDLLQFVSVKYNLTPVQQIPPHYPGDCSACHADTESWEETHYDHHQSTCESCHGFETDSEKPVIGAECSRDQTCETCHSYNQHEETYPGSCNNCHNDVNDWLTVDVDHSTYVNCESCHTDNTPENHYDGNCSSCHTVSSWSYIFYNHELTENCQSCHSKPAGHFNGQCSSCHNVNDWEEGIFNHPLSDCQSCHNNPVEHYTNDCTSCHITQTWMVNSVDHTGLADCQGCHTKTIGTDHYVGQCSNCHNTSSWSDYSFNHTGLTVCGQCHTVPSGHYETSCTNCHNFVDWSEVRFNHTGLTNCSDCHTSPGGHYPGACSSCHNVSDWSVSSYSHTDSASCATCHSAPSGHWTGDCANCHNTSDWSDYTFDHTRFTDCKACHTVDRPSGHPRGQCSACHTTDTWVIPTPIPTYTPTLAPNESLMLELTPTDLEFPTPTATRTLLPTVTPQPSDSSVSEPTATRTLLPTVTPFPTNTPVPATATRTLLPTVTGQPTSTPVPATEVPLATDTPVPTPTNPPPPTDTPVYEF